MDPYKTGTELSPEKSSYLFQVEVRWGSISSCYLWLFDQGEQGVQDMLVG